jgi:hypothetical protein
MYRKKIVSLLFVQKNASAAFLLFYSNKKGVLALIEIEK